ncbi:MAG: hypothetical protein ACRD0X_08045 [Thermoanaerobaculia bacterium]
MCNLAGASVPVVGVLCALLAVAPIASAREPTACGPFLTGEGFEGEFLLGVSYFGAIAIRDAERRNHDLDVFRGRGINHVRVWANWTHQAAPDATILDAQGNLVPGAFQRLKKLVHALRARDMTLDLTFSWDLFYSDTCDLGAPNHGEGPCWDAFQRGLGRATAALAQLSPYPDHLFFDLSNEHNEGSTSLGVAEIQALRTVVESADPSRIVSASTAGTGAKRRNADLLAGAATDFATPHFKRSRRWYARTDGRIEALRRALEPHGEWPIHLQEEARRGFCYGDDNDSCHARHFLQSLAEAARFGAAGWVFHTDAGFRLDVGNDSFYRRLDSEEKRVVDCANDGIDCLAEQLEASRCVPAS